MNGYQGNLQVSTQNTRYYPESMGKSSVATGQGRDKISGRK